MNEEITWIAEQFACDLIKSIEKDKIRNNIRDTIIIDILNKWKTSAE